MKDYARSLEKKIEIRKGIDCHDPLTKLQFKQYRKYKGKLSWLAQGTQPGLSYKAIVMSKKNAMAMIAYLQNVNRVLEKVNMKESGVCYGRVGKKED